MTRATMTFAVPNVGDRVLFVLALGPCRGEVRPAAVVRLCEGDDDTRVELAVFTRGSDDGVWYGPGFVKVLPACWNPHGAPGTWHYIGEAKGLQRSLVERLPDPADRLLERMASEAGCPILKLDGGS